MKLSELSTDRGLDVMCELSPLIYNITNDMEVIKAVGKVVNPGMPITVYGDYMLIANRAIECLPLLLKTHRPDVYGILSVMNERPVQEIAAQKLTETIRQVKELLQDEEFVSFFKSSVQQEQTEQSAPSASSPVSE